ncbi:MAG: hypothetical protein E4H03_02775 [Myxococcales bacterium]|nr:MAG: hypothetical protein E4H03_02775 [Myxococcales bacterium]
MHSRGSNVKTASPEASPGPGRVDRGLTRRRTPGWAARLETRVRVEELFAVGPGFEVDADGLDRVHSGNVRGFSRLPMTLV